MRLFSSRRASITADLRGRAARFEQRYGRAPSQRELAQASNFTTRNPKHGALDLAQLHAGWADKFARTLGVSLASVAPSVWHSCGHAGPYPHNPDSSAPVLAELELARAAQKAVALAQQEKSAWTCADLIKYLGRVLPRTGRDPATAAALLQDLADRTAPPPPRPALSAAALGRTRARPRHPARRAHPHPRPATRRDRPVDHRPGHRAPDLRRQARRPAEPDGPVPRPRLRRPRPGVPRLDQPAQSADLAATHARDPALPADPRTRDRPRRRLGSRRLTAVGWYLRGARDRMAELDRAGSRNWRGIARGCALLEAYGWPYALRIEIRALTSGAEVANCQDMQARAHSCKEGCHGTSVHRRRPGFPEQRVSHGLAGRGRPEHRDPGLEGHR